MSDEFEVIIRPKFYPNIAEDFKRANVHLTRKNGAYITSDRWDMHFPGQEEIYHKLLALGDSPAWDDVDPILSVFPRAWTWTILRCTACGENVERVVYLFNSEEYGDPLYICQDCLEKRLKAIKGE